MPFFAIFSAFLPAFSAIFECLNILALVITSQQSAGHRSHDSRTINLWILGKEPEIIHLTSAVGFQKRPLQKSWRHNLWLDLRTGQRASADRLLEARVLTEDCKIDVTRTKLPFEIMSEARHTRVKFDADEPTMFFGS